MEMEKTFNPQAVESEIYRDWESSGAFEAHRVEGKTAPCRISPSAITA